METDQLEVIQTWRAAQRQLDWVIQHYFQSVIALNSIPSDAIEVYSATRTESSGIWHEIHDQAQAMPSKIQTLETGMRKLHSVHNRSPTLVPISKLPREILVYIFYLICNHEGEWGVNCKGFHDSLPDLNKISLVCSQWRALALDEPSFWSHLTFNPDRNSEPRNYSWNLLQRSIERSPGQPLCITVITDRFPRNSTQTQVAFDYLLPFSDNIKYLRVLDYNRYRIFIPWFLGKVGTPSLQVLTLSSTDRVNQGIFDSVDESYPALSDPEYEACLLSVRSLHLNQASIEWNNPVYRNLVSLTLSNVSVGRRTHPTVDDILGILSASPQLHTLRLHTTIFPSGNHETLPSQVHLEALEYLDLRNTKTEGLLQMLPRLHVSSKQLYFEVEMHNDSSYIVAMKEFLARTNVVKLLLKNKISSSWTDYRGPIDERIVPALEGFLCMVPNLKSLMIDCDSTPNSLSSILKAMVHSASANEQNPWLPELRAFYVARGALGKDAIEAFARAYPLLQTMRLMWCELPSCADFDQWLTQTIEFPKVVNRDGEPGDLPSCFFHLA
ncbi:F-box-like protein, partial [Rhizoctonia solani AG-3 Rhs1AP]